MNKLLLDIKSWRIVFRADGDKEIFQITSNWLEEWGELPEEELKKNIKNYVDNLSKTDSNRRIKSKIEHHFMKEEEE